MINYCTYLFNLLSFSLSTTLKYNAFALFMVCKEPSLAIRFLFINNDELVTIVFFVFFKSTFGKEKMSIVYSCKNQVFEENAN